MNVYHRPLCLALEGVHGAGKSTLADELADALTRGGIVAKSFHHAAPHPMLHRTPWQRALHYAQQRADLVAADEELHHTPEAPRVVVCDRWSLSTSVDIAAGLLQPKNAMQRLVDAEELCLPKAQYVILDAPREVLHARILARGEELNAKALDDVRSRYLAFARANRTPVVDTSRPREDVIAQLMSLAVGWLVPHEALVAQEHSNGG